MNKTTIEFCDFTLNPIVGCKNNCPFCWARKFHSRYFKGSFETPEFHKARLFEKVPAIPKERNYIAQAISPDRPVVFLVDMGDIFSEGVYPGWRTEVFDYIRINSEVNFILLSKRPLGFIDASSEIPKDNTFIGTSLDYAHNHSRLNPIREMKYLGFRTFVNIEPLLSRMDMVNFSGLDFVIVGALTGAKYIPNKAWHESIKHPVIYFKKNYTAYFPELRVKT